MFQISFQINKPITTYLFRSTTLFTSWEKAQKRERAESKERHLGCCILGLVNIISQHRARCEFWSPSRFPNCSLNMAPSPCPLSVSQGEKPDKHGTIQEFTRYRFMGCEVSLFFFSRYFTALDLSLIYIWGWTSVLIYVLSGGGGEAYIHVQYTVWGGGVNGMSGVWGRPVGIFFFSLGARMMRCNRVKTLWEKMVQFVPQQLQLSWEGLALSFLSSFMGSGNSLYSSTSVSCKHAKRKECH